MKRARRARKIGGALSSGSSSRRDGEEDGPARGREEEGSSRLSSSLPLSEGSGPGSGRTAFLSLRATTRSQQRVHESAGERARATHRLSRTVMSTVSPERTSLTWMRPLASAGRECLSPAATPWTETLMGAMRDRTGIDAGLDERSNEMASSASVRTDRQFAVEQQDRAARGTTHRPLPDVAPH